MRTRWQDETCDIDLDGLCIVHSDASGPVYCIGEETLAALHRARFHEKQGYRWRLDAEARAERFRLAWMSARRRRSDLAKFGQTWPKACTDPDCPVDAALRGKR